jgi:multiple sugar transport system permease protein
MVGDRDPHHRRAEEPSTSIFVITQGGPGTASETLNIFLYLQAFQFYKIGYASAVVVIFFVIIIMLSLLLLYARQKSKWNA